MGPPLTYKMAQRRGKFGTIIPLLQDVSGPVKRTLGHTMDGANITSVKPDASAARQPATRARPTQQISPRNILYVLTKERGPLIVSQDGRV